MATLSSLKRGDTFQIYAQYAADTLLAELKSQIRNPNKKTPEEPNGELVSDVTISNGDVAGKFLLRVADTQLWPLCNLNMDIQRTVNGDVTSSETLIIPVVEDVTR